MKVKLNDKKHLDRKQMLRIMCMQGVQKRGRCCAAQLTLDLVGGLVPPPTIDQVRETLDELTAEGTFRGVHDPKFLAGMDEKYQNRLPIVIYHKFKTGSNVVQQGEQTSVYSVRRFFSLRLTFKIIPA